MAYGSVPGCRPPLYHLKHILISGSSKPPQQYQDEQDQEDQSDSAAGIRSPGLTMAPGGQGADEQKDQDNDQDDSHDIFLLFSFPISACTSFKEILRCFGHSP